MKRAEKMIAELETKSHKKKLPGAPKKMKFHKNISKNKLQVARDFNEGIEEAKQADVKMVFELKERGFSGKKIALQVKRSETWVSNVVSGKMAEGCSAFGGRPAALSQSAEANLALTLLNLVEKNITFTGEDSLRFKAHVKLYLDDAGKTKAWAFEKFTSGLKREASKESATQSAVGVNVAL